MTVSYLQETAVNNFHHFKNHLLKNEDFT